MSTFPLKFILLTFLINKMLVTQKYVKKPKYYSYSCNRFAYVSVQLLGPYDYVGKFKSATNPYFSQIIDDWRNCESRCDNDYLCNGYAIDTLINGCYLSSCTSSVSSCSSCFFASKLVTTSPDVCTTPTTTTTPPTTMMPTTEMTPASNDIPRIVTNTTLCTCVCMEVNQTLDESIENRRRDLAVKQQGLSSTTRKLTSAPDIRVTSKVIGTMAIIVLVVFGLFFFLGDAISVTRFMLTKLLNKSKSVKPM